MLSLLNFYKYIQTAAHAVYMSSDCYRVNSSFLIYIDSIQELANILSLYQNSLMNQSSWRRRRRGERNNATVEH